MKADLGHSIRGVQIIGSYADLEAVIERLAADGRTPRRMMLCPSALDALAHPETIYALARRHGIAVSRTQPLVGTEGADATPRLAPVAMEDLLLRPAVTIDRARLERLAQGRKFAITGGGGSIGSEIARRLVLFGAAEVMIIENSEPALHAIIEALSLGAPKTRISGRLCDVRDRERVFAVMAEAAPDMVIHAAALKHVNLLERDWVEGVKTNITGSINVADAALACNARAMVMVSTDKAVRPVSILGATKRLAEMYVQALEAELQTLDARPERSRLLAVRFGNVLGSTGSVVPKFREQIERGGPVTVTHPDMVRYFMTIPEASDLVLTASSHAVDDERHEHLSLCAQHGPADPHHGACRAHDPLGRPRARRGHQDRGHRASSRRALARDRARRGRDHGRYRHSRRALGAPGLPHRGPGEGLDGRACRGGRSGGLAGGRERLASALPDYPAGAVAKAPLRA